MVFLFPFVHGFRWLRTLDTCGGDLVLLGLCISATILPDTCLEMLTPLFLCLQPVELISLELLAS